MPALKLLVEILLAIDFKTAGLKTYACLAVCVGLAVLAHFKPDMLSPDDALKAIGTAAVAGLGANYLGRKREEPTVEAKP